MWQSTVPVGACSCVYGTTPEFVAFADVVVVGRLYLSETARDLPQVSVESYLKGNGPEEIDLSDLGPGDCSYGPHLTNGRRHLLLLRSEAGGLSTSSCSGSVSLDTNGSSNFAQQRLREVVAITGPGDVPGANGAPTLPLAVAAVAIPLAFVLAASFVFPARGSRP
jgi:hypothetical protein